MLIKLQASNGYCFYEKQRQYRNKKIVKSDEPFLRRRIEKFSKVFYFS